MDTAWLAGFFDGDGSVGIYRRKARDRHPEEWFLSVGFGQHSKRVLELIRDCYGGVLYHRGSRNSFGTWGEVWQLSFTHRKAEMILRDIVDHLIIKRREVEIALAFRESKNAVGKPNADRKLYEKFAKELKSARAER